MDELEMQKLLEELNEEEKEKQEKLLKQVKGMNLNEDEKKLFDHLISVRENKLRAIRDAIEIIKNRRACGDKRF
ncbi:MAG: hypothetical protein J7J73_02640 [Deltaproteobacteria bacterium]|nr:hypothetical protein [Deltaproteobacteria bacterium]